jgi:hypothetical protein
VKHLLWLSLFHALHFPNTGVSEKHTRSPTTWRSHSRSMTPSWHSWARGAFATGNPAVGGTNVLRRH